MTDKVASAAEKILSEPEAMASYKRDLEKNAHDAIRRSMFIRQRGIVSQLDVMERVFRIAGRAYRRNKISGNDYLLIRDAIWTLRMLMRVCNDREFESNEAVIEYLAAELAREYRAGIEMTERAKANGN